MRVTPYFNSPDHLVPGVFYDQWNGRLFVTVLPRTGYVIHFRR